MAVLFDATGAGDTAVNAFNSGLTTNHSHTSSGSDRAVLAFVSAYASDNGHTTRTCTYGGVSMTELVTIANSEIRISIWGLLNQATGSQTVSASVSSGSSQGRQQACNSVSFTDVSAFSTTATNSGSSSTATVSNVVSATDERVANAFAARESLSSYSQTQRFNITVPSNSQRLGGGDAPGSGDVDFQYTLGASALWAGAAVRLLPLVSSSGFFQFF
jgi:hypothetical protein